MLSVAAVEPFVVFSGVFESESSEAVSDVVVDASAKVDWVVAFVLPVISVVFDEEDTKVSGCFPHDENIARTTTAESSERMVFILQTSFIIEILTIIS